MRIDQMLEVVPQPAAGAAEAPAPTCCAVHLQTLPGMDLEKMGYVMALALEILQQTEGYDKYEQMLAGFDKIFELAENSAQSARKTAVGTMPSQSGENWNRTG